MGTFWEILDGTSLLQCLLARSLNVKPIALTIAILLSFRKMDWRLYVFMLLYVFIDAEYSLSKMGTQRYISALQCRKVLVQFAAYYLTDPMPGAFVHL